MKPICAVMIHASDVPAALTWYARAFPLAKRKVITWSEGVFECLELDGVQIEIVPADEKVASGVAGSVVYWQVDDFTASLAHFQSVGATLYRGPGEIEDGQRMCQVRDPWGNCIGLRGR
jgi:predicted enzyme related to lactoylglutathione lyase